jgi:hypothetical protein
MSETTKDWRRLKNGKPGRRFLDFHRSRCERWAGMWPWERILAVAVGVVLIVCGLAIGWLPGPGGFIAVVGAALLGVEWLPVARALDWVEVRARNAWRFLTRPIRRGRKQSER